jgi:hypothetical protein
MMQTMTNAPSRPVVAGTCREGWRVGWREKAAIASLRRRSAATDLQRE